MQLKTTYLDSRVSDLPASLLPPPGRHQRHQFRTSSPLSRHPARHAHLDWHPCPSAQVRIGKGSRGSLFVFTRGGASDAAQMDLVVSEEGSANLPRTVSCGP